MDMLSVIVITYYTAERVVKYIKDIITASNVKIDTIIVVDNTPNSDNYFKIQEGLLSISAESTHKVFDYNYIYKINNIVEFKYKSVTITLVDSSDNLAYAKGNNLGFQILRQNYKSKYVLISNEDILFKDGAVDLKRLIDDFKENNKIGVLGPNVIGIDKRKQSPCRYLSIEERLIYPYLKYPFSRWLPSKKKEIIDVDNLCPVYRLIGAFMLVDADKFKECGMFDSKIFLYAEEPILSEEMKKHGYAVYYDPRVTVIHEEGLSTVSDSASVIRKEKRIIKSNLYYYEKYMNEKRAKLFIAKISGNIFVFKYKLIHFWIDRMKK